MAFPSSSVKATPSSGLRSSITPRKRPPFMTGETMRARDASDGTEALGAPGVVVPARPHPDHQRAALPHGAREERLAFGVPAVEETLAIPGDARDDVLAAVDVVEVKEPRARRDHFEGEAEDVVAAFDHVARELELVHRFEEAGDELVARGSAAGGEGSEGGARRSSGDESGRRTRPDGNLEGVAGTARRGRHRWRRRHRRGGNGRRRGQLGRGDRRSGRRVCPVLRTTRGAGGAGGAGAPKGGTGTPGSSGAAPGAKGSAIAGNAGTVNGLPAMGGGGGCDGTSAAGGGGGGWGGAGGWTAAGVGALRGLEGRGRLERSRGWRAAGGWSAQRGAGGPRAAGAQRAALARYDRGPRSRERAWGYEAIRHGGGGGPCAGPPAAQGADQCAGERGRRGEGLRLVRLHGAPSRDRRSFVVCPSASRESDERFSPPVLPRQGSEAAEPGAVLGRSRRTPRGSRTCRGARSRSTREPDRAALGAEPPRTPRRAPRATVNTYSR